MQNFPRNQDVDAASVRQAILDYGSEQIVAAEAAARSVLRAAPGHAEALHLLAVIECDKGHYEESLLLADAAIKGECGEAAFHNTRARALTGLKRIDEADAAYRSGIVLSPNAMPIANNLGCLLRDRGDLEGALEWLNRAKFLAPTSADVASNLAEVLALCGAYADSIEEFQRAISLRPDSAEVLAKCGRLLLTLGQLDSAKNCYEVALSMRPNDAASHNNLGIIFQSLGVRDEAMLCFANAIKRDVTLADAHYNMGCLYQLDNSWIKARDCYERAIEYQPLHGPALWARCTVELPILYDSTEQIMEQRARYEAQLNFLVDKSEDEIVAQKLRATVGSSLPFFLPYQGACDRKLQAVFGWLVADLFASNPIPIVSLPALGEPIRLGIVSGYFHEHTVWRLMLRGWLGQLDRTRFQVHAYYTGAVEDAQTDLARQMSDKFVGGPGIDIRSEIVADRVHVLLYPELGMDRLSFCLAGQRLAPVQCVSWGQPETSGLPTIDYFLSSELMEPSDGSHCYTEELIRLPNIGIHYGADERTADTLDRESLGLRDESILFWCGQAIYKYLPQYDDVFAKIAERLPQSQFIFIGFEKSHVVTAQFAGRLREAFARRGLISDQYCVFMGSMSQEKFLGTVRISDLVLDSIGWSGGKSTLDALAESPVIVTQATGLMRGRHTAAILTAIGVTETIAKSTEEYIDIAVDLALDLAKRNAIRARIAAGRHRVISDAEPIRELEMFLEKAVAAVSR